MQNYSKIALGVTLRNYYEGEELASRCSVEEWRAIELADAVLNTGLTPASAPEFFAPKYAAIYSQAGGDRWADRLRAAYTCITKLLDGGVHTPELLAAFCSMI